MSQTRRRWLLSIVLVLGAVAFVGFSMVPLFENVFNDQPSTVATPKASQTTLAQKSELASARDYEIVLQQEPNNQTALLGLAQARIAMGDLKGAIAPLEKLTTLEPDQAKYLLALGQVYAAQKNYDAAIASLEKLTASYPDSAEYHLELGQVYAEQKNYDEAIAAYDRAIGIDQKDFRPVLSKAITLQQQGKIEQAKPLFEQAATLAPPQYKDRINQIATPQPAASTPSPTPK